MTTGLILNIALSVASLVVVVGLFGWSIATQRRHARAAPSAVPTHRRSARRDRVRASLKASAGVSDWQGGWDPRLSRGSAERALGR
jgi:hypothetical protein